MWKTGKKAQTENRRERTEIQKTKPWITAVTEAIESYSTALKNEPGTSTKDHEVGNAPGGKLKIEHRTGIEESRRICKTRAGENSAGPEKVKPEERAPARSGGKPIQY